MITSHEELESILRNVDLAGFTTPIKGNCRRYVVGLTHNVVWSVEILLSQLEYYTLHFDQLNLGGWTDPKTGDIVIDVSTSMESLELAKLLGIMYNQQEIYDCNDTECIPL